MTVLAPSPVPSRDGENTALPRLDPITRLPVLILFPHSRCNCRCLMCDIWRSDAQDQLSPELVVEQLAGWRALGVRRVLLSGGEPLMHPRWWELCAHLQDAGIGITILSTGLLLRKYAERIVDVCDDLVVSLDGPQPTHDLIRRVPRAFARLQEGVQAVANAAKLRNKHVALSARCTVQQSNYRQLRAVVQAARTTGVARISFLAADVSSTAFNRPSGWSGEQTAQVALNARDLPLLANELALLERDCADDFHSGFIAESPKRLRERLYDYYAALLGRGDFPVTRCNAPWVSTLIEADGTVRPCFFQPPLGRLTPSRSLASILNAPESVRWRAGLDVQRDQICHRCVCTLALRD
jgi:MoaA/NifB/PqqE/SkfB family radical SAM enzyme